MNKPRVPSDEDADFKIRFFFNSTEKVIDTIITETNKVKLLVYIYYGRKMDTNYSKLVLNCQVWINPTYVTFEYRKPHIF